jgi:hypothetical protein
MDTGRIDMRRAVSNSISRPNVPYGLAEGGHLPAFATVDGWRCHDPAGDITTQECCILDNSPPRSRRRHDRILSITKPDM